MNFGRSLSTLDQLADEAGKLSGFGLSAFLMMAKVESAQGNFGDARDFAEFVMGSVLPTTEEREDSGFDLLSQDDKVQRWKLGELAGKPLIDACLGMGDNEAACTWSLHYFNYLKSEGFPLSDKGQSSLLSVAQALLESDGQVGGALTGGLLQWFATAEDMKAADSSYRGRNARSAVDLALSIAQDVNDSQKGVRSRVKVDAQKVISNIIQRPGVSVSPEILLQAAEGDYNSKDYPQAIASLKSILSELATRDDATQREFAPHTLLLPGPVLRAPRPPPRSLFRLPRRCDDLGRRRQLG